MSWTRDQSSLLSLLLDEVVGTQEIIDIRQDYCRLLDCSKSLYKSPNGAVNSYFTGSKAEGIDLPESDEDYMMDMNNFFVGFGILKVVQTLFEADNSHLYHMFLMCTENVLPGFALLQFVNPFPEYNFLPYIQHLHGMPYLGSDIFVELMKKGVDRPHSGITTKRQGPSLERWFEHEDQSQSGKDTVLSIHCQFWPNVASEWTQRPRYFGWPSPRDITSIIEFGCHLVPIGHPHSETKLTEWRISFSVAERWLVWSFNHVQMQCYALMKIILKEFIKLKCSAINFVLCSYFIKTFLFWKYETTSLTFWCPENLRECLKFLLIEFSKCIRQGKLMHYFIPRFNLLSVKLTREAQSELLQIIDMAIQCDISIMKECKTLQGVWSKFLATENRSIALSNVERYNLLNNDICMNYKLDLISRTTILQSEKSKKSLDGKLNQFSLVVCRTPLKSLLIKRLLQYLHIRSLMMHLPCNRQVYHLQKSIHNDNLSTDISTCKLWYAFFLLKKRDYMSTLSTVNEMLSNIAPFTLYFKMHTKDSFYLGSTEAKELYIDLFVDSRETISHRLKRAWLSDFVIPVSLVQAMPLAIQIEIHFCHAERHMCVPLSPFLCAYYLMFLCYHELHQYRERDRALAQLVDVSFDRAQCGGYQHHCFNIAGHCLYLAGKTIPARECFIWSLQVNQLNPALEKYNSAIHYLRHLF